MSTLEPLTLLSSGSGAGSGGGGPIRYALWRNDDGVGGSGVSSGKSETRDSGVGGSGGGGRSSAEAHGAVPRPGRGKASHRRSSCGRRRGPRGRPPRHVGVLEDAARGASGGDGGAGGSGGGRGSTVVSDTGRVSRSNDLRKDVFEKMGLKRDGKPRKRTTGGNRGFDGSGSSVDDSSGVDGGGGGGGGSGGGSSGGGVGSGSGIDSGTDAATGAPSIRTESGRSSAMDSLKSEDSDTGGGGRDTIRDVGVGEGGSAEDGAGAGANAGEGEEEEESGAGGMEERNSSTTEEISESSEDFFDQVRENNRIIAIANYSKRLISFSVKSL